MRLAFMDEAGTAIFMASAGGEWVHEVYRNEDERPLALAWSPDNAYLAFSSSSAIENVRLLHLISTQSGELHTLDAGPNLHWAWTAESDLLVRAGDRQTLMTVLGEVLDEQVSALPVDLLPVDPSVERTIGVPSPNGQIVAYFTRQENEGFVLSFANPRTGLERKRYEVALTPQYWALLQDFELWQEGMRLWSPDGRYLAVAEVGEAGPGVWAYPAAGRVPPRRLSDGVVASWSWR
jgi:Tol biopolymer transport system component